MSQEAPAEACVTRFLPWTPLCLGVDGQLPNDVIVHDATTFSLVLSSFIKLYILNDLSYRTFR